MPRWRTWDVAPESEWNLALERESVIRPLAERTETNEAAIAAAMAALGIRRTLAYTLISRYRRRPQTSSLLPLKRGRGRKAKFLDSAREQLLALVIRDFYLTRERPSMAALVREARLRFDQQKLAAPNYRTVRRRIEALDPALVVRKREGARAAREKVQPALPSTLSPDVPLDIVQIDHTRADVILVDQEHRLPIGRPCLSLAVDVATRMVLGFHVSMEEPSALAVSLVLTHAVLPKAQWLADRELPNLDWPTSGLPRSIHLDNAQEFHSEALARGCQEYGIRVDHRPFGQPHYGGHIERLIGTMMGALHLLPGTTFSNVQDRGDYDAEGRAVLTLPELERWLALQIAGVYHFTKHSALGKTPLEAWRDGMAKRKHPPREPIDPEEFYLDFLPAVARNIVRDGVHFHGIRYWSSVLSPWAGRLKEKLLVKYDPRNISRVYVRDPSRRHWAIPYADLGQPPVALWELIEERRRQRESGHREETERVTFANILEQRRIVQEATESSQQRRRQERTPPETTSAVEPEEEDAATPAEELKPYPVEYWRRDH